MSDNIEIGFPAEFSHWSGDPAEVVGGTNGNRKLCFRETANVTGTPNGGASACNVFQLVDLSTLQKQWAKETPESQATLELSITFHRELAPSDSELPKLKATCTIHLYQAEPESIGKAWPLVISDALALGNKAIKLASCLLPPAS